MSELDPIRRRHLETFRVSRIPHRFADVVVIGSGVAGLSAALEASNREDLQVLILSKDSVVESNTFYAQGGVAAVLSPEDTGDSVDRHIEDTLKAAGGLADVDAVQITVTEGREHVQRLIELGADFDRDDDGKLHFTREGGHSAPRILHQGDSTGRELHRVLLAAVDRRSNIQCLDHTFAIDLLLTDDEDCAGVLAQRNGQLEASWARTTILASGGAGRLYRETTNPKIATGDGVAMAFRAGAVLRDLEFVQFHPTTLYLAGAERFLITEAARGEGGVLRDSRGETFMERFHELGDLAPRDVVSRGILSVMKEQGENKVWLDLSSISPDRIRTRFPNILEFCKRFGLDILRDPIPVRPSAHYHIGGVKTDEFGQTSLTGLLAAGEVASTGLHGANRLGSNSLLEGLVFGHRAGKVAAERKSTVSMPQPCSVGSDGIAVDAVLPVNRDDLARSLKSLLWYQVGVERDGPGLDRALEQLRLWIPYCLGQRFHDPESWTLQNMIQTAYLIVDAAKRREESRGVHFRADFPERDDEKWHRHSEISKASL